MAHKIKVIAKPHKNKDGSDSKTKKEYRILDYTRGQVFTVAVVYNKNEVDEKIDFYRDKLIQNHLEKHPNDLAFRRKHKMER